MCRPKPGPRCANHLETKLVSLTAKLNEANANADHEEVREIKMRLMDLREQYFGTPQGQRELEQRLEEAEGEEREMLTDLQDRSKRRYEIALEAQRLNEKAEEGLARHKDRLESHDADIKELNKKASQAIAAHERAVKKAQELRTEYEMTGGPLGPNADALRQKKQNAEAEAETLRDAATTYSMTSSLYQRRNATLRAAIMAGIENQPKYEGYGQAQKSEDGGTNAYYLHKVPGIEHPMYVRVMNVDDNGHLVLESKQTVKSVVPGRLTYVGKQDPNVPTVELYDNRIFAD